MNRRRGRILLILGAVVVGASFALNRYLLDGLDGWILGSFYQDDTAYASGYSDTAFRHVRVGMAQDAVSNALGRPLSETWIYERGNADVIVAEADDLRRVRSVSGPQAASVSALGAAITLERIQASLGPPSLIVWAYTRTEHDSSYRIRTVVIRDGHVARVAHEYYLD